MENIKKIANKLEEGDLRDNLYYRRQFILGPRYINENKNWRKKKIGENLFLTIHPELEFNFIYLEGRSIFLLGFMLDPYNTKASNKDIISKLIRENKSFKEVIRATYKLGGRWIIIYQDENSIKMFHDPAGDRQIFYTVNESEKWYGSQPHTIAKQLKLSIEKDEELNNFINSPLFNNSEHAWIGDGTKYSNVKHLLPNKYLDLKLNTSIRYWPYKKLKKISLKNAVEKSSNLLRGLLKSANNKYNLILPVTAGMDSRTLLAASKDINKDVFYFVQKFGELNDQCPDINVPKRLFKRINLKFNVLECEREVGNDFDFILKNNISIIQSEKKKYYIIIFTKILIIN